MLYFVLFVWDLLLKLSFPETSFGGFFRTWIALLENNWCKVSTSCMYDCTLRTHIHLIYLCGDISLFFSAIFSKEYFHVHFLFDWISQEKWENSLFSSSFFFCLSPLIFLYSYRYRIAYDIICLCILWISSPDIKKYGCVISSRKPTSFLGCITVCLLVKFSHLLAMLISGL